MLEHLFSGAKTTEELLNRLSILKEETTEVYINEYDTISINKLRSIILEEINNEYTTTQIYKNLKKYFCD